MQMLYNSENYVVVQFDRPGAGDEMLPSLESSQPADRPVSHPGSIAAGGYEIVDKFAGKEIFIDGSVADGFRLGVEALMQKDPSQEDLDEFISQYTVLAHAPIALH